MTRSVTYEYAAEQLGLDVEELMVRLRDLGWVTSNDEPQYMICVKGLMGRRKHQYRDGSGSYRPVRHFKGWLTQRGLHELTALLRVAA